MMQQTLIFDLRTPIIMPTTMLPASSKVCSTGRQLKTHLLWVTLDKMLYLIPLSLQVLSLLFESVLLLLYSQYLNEQSLGVKP